MKRWTLGETSEECGDGEMHSFPQMVEAEDGEYVTYADHCAEIERIKNDRADIAA